MGGLVRRGSWKKGGNLLMSRSTAQCTWHRYDPNYDEEGSGGEDGDGPSAPSDDEDDDG